jgi:hypothetical protein
MLGEGSYWDKLDRIIKYLDNDMAQALNVDIANTPPCRDRLGKQHEPALNARHLQT